MKPLSMGGWRELPPMDNIKDKGKEQMKLNLGSGKKNLDINGYVNIDIANGAVAYPLNYESGTVDEIRASHILEHFGQSELLSVLKNWVDKLRPGGVLKIAVPDFKKIAFNYLENKPTKHNVVSYIVGGQDDENDFHKMVFDKKSLTNYLKDCGLDNIQTWKSEIKDCAAYDISLNLMGEKPIGIAGKTKIHAVMSMPRLAFTDNMYAAIRVFPALGIGFDKGTGVFWGQILTNLLERHLEDGTEYIITVDYDTWFRQEHVIKMLQLMAENPDVDAIIPVQTKRENEVPMFAVVPKGGEKIKKVPISEFDKDLIPIVGGHFGLTVFRVSAFKDLKKPWFLPMPDKDGGWNEGKIDEDIHFWHNFYNEGRKTCLATQVNIGHLQLMATFPGKASNHFKPVHVYMSDVEKGLYPDNAVPKVEFKK